MNPLFVRERLVWQHIKANPTLCEPLEALCAVVWPTEDFSERFGTTTPSTSARTWQKRCEGCGRHLDLTTPGCKHCAMRHWHREHRASPARACRGCEGPLESYTEDCPTCSERHRSRLRRAA